MNITFRKAESRDSLFLFNLRNEPDVRRFSLTPDPIPYDSHVQWLERKLASADSVLLIAEEERPIAQVRFDVKDGRVAEISIAVVAEFRGKGYGTRVIREASRLFWEHFPEAILVRAYINTDNTASFRSFTKAGYEVVGESEEGGKKRYLLILEKHPAQEATWEKNLE